MDFIYNRSVDRRNVLSCSSALLILAGFVAIGVPACKKSEAEMADSKTSLPVDRVITDNEGRQVHVRIVKRTKTHISIIRDPDNQRERSDGSLFRIPREPSRL